MARSTDGGRNFVGESRLDLDGWPLKPTELAVDGSRIYATQLTGGEDPESLYFSRSTAEKMVSRQVGHASLGASLTAQTDQSARIQTG